MKTFTYSNTFIVFMPGIPPITPKLMCQEIDDVLIGFYRLGKKISTPDPDMKNYIVIRLVTVIEQFFRKIVEIQVKNHINKHTTLARKINQVIPQNITIDRNNLKHINTISEEFIISLHFSFQHVYGIEMVLKFFVDTKQRTDQSENYNLEKINDLFKLRHDTVHTMISVDSIDLKQYYNEVEQLMKYVLYRVYNEDKAFFLSKTLALIRLNEYNEALKCCNETIELGLDDDSTYVFKGCIFHKLGRKKEAMECCDKAIELKTNNSSMYVLRGSSLAEEGKHMAALEHYNNAIKLNPNVADAYYLKSSVFAMLGKHKEAIEWYDKAEKYGINDAGISVIKEYARVKLSMLDESRK